MTGIIDSWFREMKMRIKVLVEQIRRRRQLRRICDALDIRPYRWQRDFALGLIGCDAFPKGR